VTVCALAAQTALARKKDLYDLLHHGMRQTDLWLSPK